MDRFVRVGIACALVGSAILVGGCYGAQSTALISPRDSLALDLTRESTPGSARAQAPEEIELAQATPPPLPTAPPPALPPTVPGNVKGENPAANPPLFTPLTPLAAQPGKSVAPDNALPGSATPGNAPPGKAPPTPPPPLPGTNETPAPDLPTPPPSGAQQVGLKNNPISKVRVRAWVNGKPLFDDEIFAAIPGNFWKSIARLPEVQRQEEQAKMFSNVLDNIIDQEAAYQEAIRKIQKLNPRALDKLREMASEEYQKQVRGSVNKKQEDDPIVKEALAIMKRQVERHFIHMEYLRSIIVPKLSSRISFAEVDEYYRTHLNEFVRVDTVQWQNVFIGVNPNRPTVAHCRRFAEQMLGGLPNAGAFEELAKFDDGDSKFRNGAGYGQRKGEIKPAELEPILFQLKEGEIGPIVEISTGVHLMRVTKREYGGQMPFNEDVQKQIRNKLRSIIADREYKRLLKEIRDRSVIEVDRDS